MENEKRFIVTAAQPRNADGQGSTVMTPLGRLVLALRDQHQTHVFHYTPDVPQIEVPPPDWCIDILKEVTRRFVQN
jgi:hypothetical protein